MFESYNKHNTLLSVLNQPLKMAASVSVPWLLNETQPCLSSLAGTDLTNISLIIANVDVFFHSDGMQH